MTSGGLTLEQAQKIQAAHAMERAGQPKEPMSLDDLRDCRKQFVEIVTAPAGTWEDAFMVWALAWAEGLLTTGEIYGIRQQTHQRKS